MYTFEALQLFLFLIPGFISSKLLDSFLVRKETSKEFENIIEALIFSMSIYTIYSFTGEKSPITLNQSENIFSYNYDTRSFAILFGISILLPIVIASIVNNDLHMKLVRFLKITNRTGRLSVWHDTFYDKKYRVVIDFVDGRRLFGWVEHYSDNPDKQYLYLAQPQWIDGDKFIDIGLEGMLITPEQKISFIEFLKDDDNNLQQNKSDAPKLKRRKHGK